MDIPLVLFPWISKEYVILNTDYFYQNGFLKSLLTVVLYDHFKLMYMYLNEGDKIRECCHCLKLMIEAHLHVRLFTIFFVNLLQSNDSRAL